MHEVIMSLEAEVLEAPVFSKDLTAVTITAGQTAEIVCYAVKLQF